MPKLKTRKSVVKKVKITGSGKLKTRATGQNHYNSRNTGDQTRSKRQDNTVYPAVAKNIKASLPYSF
ncbi:MAG: 50S ribosomal protein L35 [Candidatus Moranbacteria bacterium]|nr:50S ribosomal protein L35 [Candidatus Moranbacteria bacterium]